MRSLFIVISCFSFAMVSHANPTIIRERNSLKIVFTVEAPNDVTKGEVPDVAGAVAALLVRLATAKGIEVPEIDDDPQTGWRVETVREDEDDMQGVRVFRDTCNFHRFFEDVQKLGLTDEEWFTSLREAILDPANEPRIPSGTRVGPGFRDIGAAANNSDPIEEQESGGSLRGIFSSCFSGK